MRRFAPLLCIAVLSTCSPKEQASCPELANIVERDPAMDARAALARSDNRLLMLGGLVGTIPGVTNAGNHSTRMLEGTSDTETEACRKLRPKAKDHAARYNAIIAADIQSSS
jgi:hypothetical protein